MGYAYAHRIRERAAYDWMRSCPSIWHRAPTDMVVGTTVLTCLIDLLELQGLRHLYSCVTLPNEKEHPHAAQTGLCGRRRVARLRLEV